MPRKSKPIEEPDLEMLPDAFRRVVEKEVSEAVSTPKRKRPTAADVPGVGGMEKTKWSGLDMWRCPKCHGTTFNEADSRVHKCPQVKYADEEGLAE